MNMRSRAPTSSSLSSPRCPDVQNLNLPACNRLFGKLLKDNPLYSNIFLANDRGMLVASAKPFTPFSVEHRKFFRDTMQSRRFSAGEYVKGVIVRRSVFHFSYPVLDAHKNMKGLVAVAVDLASYGNVFAMAKLPEHSVLAISDHNHTILYRYPNPEKYIGSKALQENVKSFAGEEEQGLFRGTGFEGVPRLFAFKQFRLGPGQPFYMVMRVGIYEKEALASMKRNFLINIALLWFAFIAALLLSWVLGSAIITRRMNRVIEASTQLGHGDLSARTGLHHSESEFGQLAAAFDGMATALEQKEAERLSSEQALRRSEEKFRSLVEHLPQNVFIKDSFSRYITCNRHYARGLGLEIEDIVGKTDYEFHRKELADGYRADDRKVIESGKAISLEEKYVRSGEERWAWTTKVPFRNQQGDVIGVMGIFEDITDRKTLSEKLFHEQERLRIIFDASPSGIILVDPSGIITFANQRMADMFGCALDELVGSSYPSHVHPDQRSTGDARMRQLIRGEVDSVNTERYYIRKDGTGFWGYLSGRRQADESGTFVNLVGIIMDITALKQVENTLKASLKEKESLLKEIHHRVKNNLMVVSSILSLQSGTIRDQKVRDLIEECRRRIQVMSLIHNKLYRSANLAHIGFREYTEDLLGDIASSYGDRAGNIALVTDVGDISFDIETAIPLGLIMNELVSNAMKHAFPAERKGTITVNLNEQEGSFRLTVGDDGAGFPEDLDFTATESLGMQLVVSLVEQLDGTIELITDNGTEFRVTFGAG